MDRDLASRLLAAVLARGGEYAEAFAEKRRSVSLRLEEGRIEAITSGSDAGISLRLVRDNATVFGYSESEEESELVLLARHLSSGLAQQGKTQTYVGEAKGSVAASAREAETSAGESPVDVRRAVELLRAVDQAARSSSPEVVQVVAQLAGSEQKISVANSTGVWGEDKRRRVFLAITVVARRESVVQTARKTLGFNGTLVLPDVAAASALGAEAAAVAVTMLDARPAPTGRMPVVLASGFGGVLFHEACGHGLEADYILKGTSVWKDKLGTRVAPPFLTAYDDGVGGGLWGTTAIDDEGTPTRRTAVIEDGVLTAFLSDILRSRRLQIPLTGNARRESFRHLPYPRMTNTYFAPGQIGAEDLIADTKRALYARSLSGGEVNPATGDFVFGVSEGYLIENGRVTAPVRGATLIGNGIEVLASIEAVANDLEVEPGFCGKEGQLVPVGTGQPTIRVSKMTVGGTDVS